MPADSTLERIASVLEIAPGYLKGGYTLPVHLVDGDVLLLADRRNVPYLKLVREAAERGVSTEDLRKLVEIITKIK